jgi:hypothetical protein
LYKKKRLLDVDSMWISAYRVINIVHIKNLVIELLFTKKEEKRKRENNI